MNETWRVIPDFTDYAVSDLGRVMSRVTDLIKTPTPNQQGILNVLLMRDRIQYRRSVALLVANTFLSCPEPPADTPVHRDGDRANCQVDNLFWRPRWFAVKYHQQMKEGSRIVGEDPIVDLRTGNIYKSMWDAATTLVMLERDIFHGVTNWTPVYPGGVHFRYLEDT